MHVLDSPATSAIRRELGISREGTRVTVPLAEGGCRRTRACAGWSPTSCSCGRSSRTRSRELLLELPGEPLQLIRYTPPEPRPGAAVAVRRRDRASARHHRAGHRSPSRAADPAQPCPRRPAAAGSSSAQAAPRTRRRSPASRPVPAPGTCTARFAATRSSSCSGRRSKRRGRRSSCASTAAASTRPTRSCAGCTRSSSGYCVRSSTPRSDGPARVSSAPAGRPRPRRGRAARAQRRAPRRVRRARASRLRARRRAHRAAAARTSAEQREAVPPPAAPGPSAAVDAAHSLQAVAGTASPRRAANRLAHLRPEHGSRPARRSTSPPTPACRSRSGATRSRRRFRADGRA